MIAQNKQGARKLRGLQHIRTYSGMMGPNMPLHKAYIRLSVLEQERSLREKEKAKVIQHWGELGQRFQDINTEQAKLLQLVGVKAENSATTDDNTTAPNHNTSAPNHGSGGFKIKY